jgi:hypothetical protein
MCKALFAVLILIAFLESASGQMGQAPDQGATDAPLELGGKIIGNGAFDDKCQRIGTIEEVVFDNDGNLYELIVNVSAYLGVDERRISLSPSEVKLQLNDLDDKCPEQVLVLIDKDQLSQKPAAVTSPSR